MLFSFRRVTVRTDDAGSSSGIFLAILHRCQISCWIVGRILFVVCVHFGSACFLVRSESLRELEAGRGIQLYFDVFLLTVFFVFLYLFFFQIILYHGATKRSSWLLPKGAPNAEVEVRCLHKITVRDQIINDLPLLRGAKAG